MPHRPERPIARGIALVADDDTQTRSFVRQALDGAGFHVLEASDGAEAEELASQHGPEVAILDVVMPRVSGLQLVRRWRSAGLRMGVIVLTSDRDPEIGIEALEIGADDCMSKPVSTRELLARVWAVVRRVRASPTN